MRPVPGRAAVLPVCVLVAAFAVAGAVFGVLADGRSDDAGFELMSWPVSVLLAVCAVGYVTVGGVVVRKAEGHPVGWLLLASGSVFAVGLAAGNAADWRAAGGHVGTVPAIGSWAHDWTWEVGAALAVAALALFPYRRPPSRFARVLVTGIGVYAVVQVIGITLAHGPLVNGARLDNPFGVDALGGVPQTAVDVAEAASWVATIAAMVSLIWRYRAAAEAPRQQLRWLAIAVLAFLGAVVVSVVTSLFDVDLSLVPFLFALVGIPAAMVAAILRDHLYGIDVIVDRVVVYTLLATVIAAVCAGVTLIVRALFAGGEPPASVVSIVAVVAATVVALPARDRLARLADRVVFGRRATPYHALGTFAEQSAAAGTINDLAPRLAGLVTDATGAATVVVYVRVDDEFVPVAREPNVPEGGNVAFGDLGSVLERFDLAKLVERRGEVLGALALTMPAGTPVRPAERRLVEQLAAQAALGFETLRLTAELTRHAEALTDQASELRESRQRLVYVQDAERQRIGRDLHDGAQQQLIAIIAKAMLARTQLGKDPELADTTLQELQHDTRTALAEIRAFVNGIFPQVLADHGLVVALQQQAKRLPIDVSVDVDAELASQRLDSSVESTAWFVVSEALANVAKHAHAERAWVRLRHDDGLRIDVRDDGVGINGERRGSGLTNMSDRVAAIGGAIAIERDPAGGTLVSCRLPLDGGISA